MSQDEFERILEHLRKSDPAKVAPVLNQDKHRVWFEDITSEACLFQDVVSKQCVIYPARPLICRLFGRVEWLPCPLERELPQLHESVKLMQTYARLRRATFPEWCAEAGIFDPSQVVGKPR
jgi:Fe-S-cluster containining protein